MTHTCPWERLQGVSSHHLPGKQEQKGAQCQPLPGCQVRITRLPDKWRDGLKMETPSPFPEGFMHAGWCRSLKRGAGHPPGAAWPGTSATSTDDISQPASSLSRAGSPHLASKKGEKGRMSAFVLVPGSCSVLALLALQWKVVSRWAAACHLHPGL